MVKRFGPPLYTADQMREYARAALAMHQPQGDKVAEACAAAVAAAMGEPEGASLEELCIKLESSRKPLAWRAWPDRDSGDITTSRATTELWRKNGVPFRALAYINDVVKQAGKESQPKRIIAIGDSIVSYGDFYGLGKKP
jgi:hypothetical protein